MVCCFQVMDHIAEPAVFLRAVHSTLAKDGIFLAINHDIRSPITRLLGERSPMYDIEHIYLFDRSTIRKLFVNCGFDVLECRTLYNSYTFDYALKMFPFPPQLKKTAAMLLKIFGLSRRGMRVAGGNMVTIGRKRAP